MVQSLRSDINFKPRREVGPRNKHRTKKEPRLVKANAAVVATTQPQILYARQRLIAHVRGFSQNESTDERISQKLKAEVFVVACSSHVASTFRRQHNETAAPIF